MKPSGVQLFIRQVCRRQMIVSLARQWRLFLWVALGVYAVALLAARLGGVFPGWFTLATLAVFLALASVLAWVSYRRTTPIAAARLADAHMGTQDLYLTASLIDHSLGAYQSLVLQAAEQRAAQMSPKEVVPFHWQRDALKVIAAVLVLSLGMYFLPQLDPFGLNKRQKHLTEQRERLREMNKATEVRTAVLQKKSSGESTDVVKQAVAGLEKVFQEAKPNDQAGTLARLNEQQKNLGQLWRQAGEEKLKNGLNLPPPTQSFGLADPTKTTQMRNDLQKGDVSSTQKELSEVSKMAQELAKTQDAVQREKLRQDIMNRLQNLKDTLGQQMNSQALNADLQRAMEQLALADAPGLSGEALKGMSDSLKLTQEELQQLAKAMADMKNLEDALKALQLAKALHSMQPLDGQDFAKLGDLAAYAAFCQGKCQSLYPGMGMGEGQGIGPRPYGDDQAKTDFQPGKSASMLQPGRMLMEWKTREVSEAGPAREEYLRAMEDVRQQASEAVVHEQVPPGYQDAIKKYFDTLHNDSSANPKP